MAYLFILVFELKVNQYYIVNQKKNIKSSSEARIRGNLLCVTLKKTFVTIHWYRIKIHLLLNRSNFVSFVRKGGKKVDIRFFFKRIAPRYEVDFRKIS